MGRNKAPEWDEFWKTYPVHKARKEAMRAWNRLSASKKAKAVAGIPRYRDECLRTGVAFCYGQTYLNQERWTDDEDTTETVTSQGEEPQLFPSDPLDGMETW